VFENYVHDIYVDDQQVELSLWDTAGVLSCVQVIVPELMSVQGRRSSTVFGRYRTPRRTLLWSASRSVVVSLHAAPAS
jgi:hypothetical protein